MGPELTVRQFQAVTTPAEDVLVLAGAGAGKTSTMVQRIAHLLAHGASASDLLVLTFTRKAASEMRDRIGTVLIEAGKDAGAHLREMKIGTFHAVALGMITADAEVLGYRGQLTIADEGDAFFLLERVAAGLGYLNASTHQWGPGLSAQTVLKARDDWYSTGTPVANDTAVGRILSEYRAQLYAMNVLDFGLILVELDRLLQMPDRAEAWRARIKHTLVDEMQDADEIQYNMHEQLRGGGTFFGVGDRRQSIYGFRGARPELMTEMHPDAQVIDLQECFRCGDVIVRGANRLIAFNRDRLSKPMIGATGRKGRVQTLEAAIGGVIEMIRVTHSDGFAWSDIAVLARNHGTLWALAGELREHDAPPPCRQVGEVFEIVKSPEFRAIQAMMRLAVNPGDDLALLRLVPMITDTTHEAIRAEAVAEECGHFDAWARLVDDFPRWAVEIRRGESAMTATMLVGSLIYKPDAFTDAGLDKERLPEVLKFWTDQCPGGTIGDALLWLAMADGQDDHNTDADVVTLCTIHAAKGLEWPVVIVADCNEGTFPSVHALAATLSPQERLEAIEEERRIFYVAVTRAAERLILHSRPPQPGTKSGAVFKPLSRFVNEFLA